MGGWVSARAPLPDWGSRGQLGSASEVRAAPALLIRCSKLAPSCPPVPNRAAAGAVSEADLPTDGQAPGVAAGARRSRAARAAAPALAACLLCTPCCRCAAVEQLPGTDGGGPRSMQGRTRWGRGMLLPPRAQCRAGRGGAGASRTPCCRAARRLAKGRGARGGPRPPASLQSPMRRSACCSRGTARPTARCWTRCPAPRSSGEAGLLTSPGRTCWLDPPRTDRCSQAASRRHMVARHPPSSARAHLLTGCDQKILQSLSLSLRHPRP